MSWDNLKTPTNDKPKDAIYKSTSSNHFYAIFRIGKKFKNSNVSINLTMNAIRNFQKHMEREQETPNANINIQNEILIGDKNITENVQEYIKNVKLRKNAIIARELLLTASPDFFKGMQQNELDTWEQLNRRWLEKEFGENVRYAVLHLDEST